MGGSDTPLPKIYFSTLILQQNRRMYHSTYTNIIET